MATNNKQINSNKGNKKRAKAPAKAADKGVAVSADDFNDED